jgi:hypothetical protein
LRNQAANSRAFVIAIGCGAKQKIRILRVLRYNAIREVQDSLHVRLLEDKG